MSAFTLVKEPGVTKMDVPRESFLGYLGNEDTLLALEVIVQYDKIILPFKAGASALFSGLNQPIYDGGSAGSCLLRLDSTRVLDLMLMETV